MSRDVVALVEAEPDVVAVVAGMVAAGGELGVRGEAGAGFCGCVTRTGGLW